MQKRQREKDGKVHPDSDDDDVVATTKRTKSTNTSSSRIKYTNKQRCLVLCSRGAVAQYRHLMGDIRRMLPHHKKEVKLDTKRDLSLINEICEMKSCNTCLFFVDIR